MVSINFETREAPVNEPDGSLEPYSHNYCTKSFCITSIKQKIKHITHLPRLVSHFAMIDDVLNAELVNLATQSQSLKAPLHLSKLLNNLDQELVYFFRFNLFPVISLNK